MKEPILRVAKRKLPSSFYGVLSKETGEKLEKAIIEMRKKRNEAQRIRIKRIIGDLRE
jgi:hypothetical protein